MLECDIEKQSGQGGGWRLSGSRNFKWSGMHRPFEQRCEAVERVSHVVWRKPFQGEEQPVQRPEAGVLLMCLRDIGPTSNLKGLLSHCKDFSLYL